MSPGSSTLTRAASTQYLKGPPTLGLGGQMALDTKDLSAIAAEFAGAEPREIIALALKEYAGDLAISFSGAEDVVLVDMAHKIGGRFAVFSLDTGRLHPETYQFIDKVRTHYDLPVDTFFPQPEAVQKLVH